MIERRKDKKYVGKFLEDDYEKFEKDFLSLLKDYKRKTQRLDKIIKQSDKQQFQFLKMNEELEEYKDKLEVKIENDKVLFQNSRHAQMGEMISMIAHQWRQPLASMGSTIIGLQLNQRSGKYDLSNKNELEDFLKMQNERFDRLTHQINLMSNTIDDFSDFFKPTKKKVLVNLSSPVKKVLSMVSTGLESKGISILVDFIADDTIEIYQNEIIQVLLNIIQNSEDNFVKKNVSNPTINILTYYDNDGYPTISIKDNGLGISDAIISKIFDPYFSTKEEKNGMGIGLYMSKMIVEEHNDGKLRVSNIADGVCFTITLNSK